jgi:GntR family transcriptional regulator
MSARPPEARKLNGHSAEPLYAQLRDELRALIRNEDYGPNEQFPGDLDLAKAYGVSRVTVRQAVADLVDEGLLIRRPGKGTFVCRPKIRRQLINVAGFTARVQAAGLHPGSRLISKEIISGDHDLCERLAVPLAARILRVRRLRLTEGEPTSIEDTYLSLDRFPELEHFDFNSQSLYQFLEEEYQVKPGHAHRLLDLAYATAEEGQLLDIPPGSPLFLLRATVRSTSGDVIEYVKIRFMGDRYRFEV